MFNSYELERTNDTAVNMFGQVTRVNVAQDNI